MDPALAILGLLTLAGAAAAMTLRNLVHCALCLAVAFGGIALLYLKLSAQFVGLVQLLVYVGAVSILVVFAILLTRGSDAPRARIAAASWRIGVGIAVLTAGTLVLAIWTSVALEVRRERPPLIRGTPPSSQPAVLPAAPEAPVRRIGERLMLDYVLPLQAVALLLTAALVGGVIIGMRDRSEDATGRSGAGSQPSDAGPAPIRGTGTSPRAS